MSLFSSILEKLGLKKKEEEAKPVVKPTVAPTKPVTSVGAGKPPLPHTTPPTFVTPTGPVTAPKPSGAPQNITMSEMDVVSKLDKLAKANPQKLDWKVSIVDLLKLLDLDSSLAARKEMAVELGCPPEKMTGDYAEMNTWLHKTVLQKIAINGGNIPKNLLD